MAQPQLEKTRRSSESPRSAPIAHQTSPTFEQLLRVQETPCTRSQPHSTSSPTFEIHHDHEENLSPDSHNRKSVLTKVKEQAKKLRHTLSSRRKPEHEHEMSDGNSVHMRSSLAMDHNNIQDIDNVDDKDDELDRDPEYLGAPMYESEAAPEILKETARQHPRAVPVVSEKHLTPNCAHPIQESGSPNANMPNFTYSNQVCDGPHPTMANRVSEKLAHPITAVSDATHNIASRITTGLTISTPEDPQKGKSFNDHHIQSGVLGRASDAASTPTPRQIDGPSQLPIRMPMQIDVPGQHPIRTPIQNNVPDQHSIMSGVEDSSGHPNHKYGASSSPQTYDKGVSVKEYFMNKLEPGEDEKALSHAITEAMSPRNSNAIGDGPGVVDKFKGAVASILAHVAEPSTTSSFTAGASSSELPTYNSPSSNVPTYSPQIVTASPIIARPTEFTYSPAHTHTHTHAKTSPVIQISTPHKVVEEENHGKILQAN